MFKKSFVLCWEGWKCQWSSYFSNFSVICVCRQNFICKTCVLYKPLFFEVHRVFTIQFIMLPLEGLFQGLVFLMRCSESLSFNHRLHSSWRGLGGWNVTLRWNNFVVNVVYVNFTVGLISICCLLFELDISVVVICAVETLRGMKWMYIPYFSDHKMHPDFFVWLFRKK